MDKPTYEQLETRLEELENEKARLRVQAIYLEKLFNSAPEAIIWHDNNDVVINVNDEFTRMFGYAREEAIGRRINDLVAPKEYLPHAEMFSDMVLHGQRIEGDSKRRRKDGSVLDVSILGAPIIHEGKQMGVFAIYRDITERKKAEEEVLLQKTYLERLFNSAPEAIVWHNNQDRIVNVNDEFTRMFGYSREEAVGEPINDLLVPEELKAEGASFSARVISGERIEADTKRKRKDGSLVDVWVIGSPIVREGKQMGDYAIYRDITERKRAEEEILVQKTYLENLFNSAPEGIVWHDNDDVVVNVNDEFTKMFGYSRKEAVGRRINDLLAPRELESEAEMFSHMVNHGDRVAADSRRRRKDGTVFDVSILGAPIFHEGKQFGVYAIYRDITERKKAEEARLLAETEARTAKHIQMNFLPDSDPVVPGYEIAGRSVPALNVGGDYYDFIRLDDDRIAIGLGDVSGHGLPSALVMANLQATIRSQVSFDPDPARCLRSANRLLYHSTDSHTFVSLFYGILDTRRHSLSYANAGQNWPIVFPPAGEPRVLMKHGLVLGIREDAAYEKDEIKVGPGDRLLIYSDGVTEAMDEEREQFGEGRLTDVVCSTAHGSARSVLESILHAVSAYAGKVPQLDDMTVVFVERKQT